MAKFQQMLISANRAATTITTFKAPEPIRVIESVKQQREVLQREFGYKTNDPKIGLVSFHTFDPGNASRLGIGLILAPGITIMDDKWAQRNLYPRGDPLDAFDRYDMHMPNTFALKYSPKLSQGAYMHVSTFALVVGYDGNKDFDQTYALLVEKKTGQQQAGAISIANQGIEAHQVKKEGKAIDEISLETEMFRRAVRYDAATTLMLDEAQMKGYQDIGLALMPGSADAGGLLVAEINAAELEKRYQEDSGKKKPIMVKTAELSDFLRSGVEVNSLLEDTALGSIIHNRERFGALYEEALKHKVS